MIKYLPYLISVILITVIGRLVYRVKVFKVKDNVVKQPQLYASGGMFISLFSLAFVVFLLIIYHKLNQPDGLVIVLFFGAFILIGVMLLIGYINWEVTVDEEYLTYRNWFRRTKKYPIKDLSFDDYLTKTRIYHKDKEILELNYLMQNDDIVLSFIKKERFDEKDKRIIKGSSTAKGLGILILFVGLLWIVVPIITIVTGVEEWEKLVGYLLITVPIIIIYIGILFLLHYKVFKIVVSDYMLEYTNLFGKKRTYQRSELSYKETKNGLKIYHNNKKICYLNENLTERTNLLYSLREKED
ncbi:MAG TPA: hypothetical protein GX003_04305 [Acholeplasmataceae bacterium]|nr:hypothetical protein [Acholeplasmataceae bacterium]